MVAKVESHESTRQRAESLQSKTHDDRIAGKGFTLMIHHDFVHKFLPMPQATKIPDATAAVDKEWKKLETIPTWDLEKSQEQKGSYFWEARRDKQISTLLHWWTYVTSKNAELEPKQQKYWSRMVFREDIVKSDSGASAVFT